jgi:hypothetical protein
LIDFTVSEALEVWDLTGAIVYAQNATFRLSLSLEAQYHHLCDTPPLRS